MGFSVLGLLPWKPWEPLTVAVASGSRFAEALARQAAELHALCHLVLTTRPARERGFLKFKLP